MRTFKKPKNQCHIAVMGRQRSNVSFDLDEEGAKKRTRVSDKDRVGSEMEHTEKEDRRDARHGRVVDLKERTNSRHGISGGERYNEGKEGVSKRYKEERGYERKQNSSSNKKEYKLDISREDKENKKPRDTSVRELVSRGREHSSYKDNSEYRFEKESCGTDRYRDGKYQDQRPKRKYQDSSSYKHERYTHEHWYKDEKRCDKYQDGVEREKHYNREDHKYVDERKSTKCGGEDCRGEKRLYAQTWNSGDLKGTNSKVMRGELDKHVPRHGHRKVEYLSSDNFHKRVSNSGTMLIKGQSRNNNLREEEKQEEHPHKVLSPVYERSNSPFRSQNDRTDTYPLNTLRYSQPWFPESKDNMMGNLTCSSQPAMQHTLSNNNSWNKIEEAPFQYWGSQWLGYQAGNSTFCNYGGWENSYINDNYNCNPNLIGNINNENGSWNKTNNVPFQPSLVPNTSTCWPFQVPRPAGFHSTFQQWPVGMRSQIPEGNPAQVAYNSNVEMNPLLSKPNPLCWQNNSVAAIQQIGPFEATADKLKPNAAAFSILESAEPKKPDNVGLSVTASDRPPDLNTQNSVKNDGSKVTKSVERTPFLHNYYLSQIGVSSDLVPPDMYEKCMSILQKSGAERASGLSCSENLPDNKRVTKKGSNSILKRIFPIKRNDVFQKSLSLYAAQTGKFIIPNEPVTSVSLGEGQTVTDACSNTDKMEVEGDNEEKLSIEVCLEKSANSDKKQNGAVVPSDDS